MDAERPTPTPVVEHHPTPRSARPHYSYRFLRRVRDFLNPVYHLRRIREDFAAAYHAIRNWNFNHIRYDEDRLARAFRGKMFASFFFAGAFMLVAVALALKVQFVTSNRYLSIAATLIFSFLLTTAAYQVFWGIANTDFYRTTQRNLWRRFLQLERDLWPIHLLALKMMGIVAAVAGPVNVAIAWGVGYLPNEVGNYVPMPVIVAIVNMIVIDGTFIRAMGDKFDTHSRFLARKYGGAR